MSDFLNILLGAGDTFADVYLGFMRFLAPVLALLLLWRCCKPLLTFRREAEIWAWLCFPDGQKRPITHWETILGRHKRCDVVIDCPTVSRNHAVLTRYDDGSWTVADANSKGGVRVNGKKVSICAIGPEDEIDLSGVKLTLQPISHQQEKRLAQIRTKASSGVESITNLLLLSIFQALTCIGFLIGGTDHGISIISGFGLW